MNKHFFCIYNFIKHIVIIFFIFIHVCSVANSFSENINVNKGEKINNKIGAILFHRAGIELSLPIIELNTSDKLLLSFDDLDGGYKPYRYTVIHCNANWQPDDLWQNDFIAGFTEGYISDYKTSFNTLQTYTHYSVILPNDNFKIKLSGNYILSVYEDGKNEQPIFERRFMIIEPQVDINAKVQRASRADLRFTHQEIPFNIITKDNIYNPFTNLQVIISQNYRWDNAISNLKPLIVRNNELDYGYTDGSNSFAAGNEYRYFDIKSIRYNSDQVRAIESNNNSYNVYLYDKGARQGKAYESQRDINGLTLIKSDDYQQSSIESEYVWVNFFLPETEEYANGDVYIIGVPKNMCSCDDKNIENLNNEQIYKMEYSYPRQGYSARLYLKQGYYNYMYAFKQLNKNTLNNGLIEGNYWETQNIYSIYVYYKEPGGRYDKLIGFKTIENK